MNASLTKSCCFIGHRKILKTQNLIFNLKYFIEDLILNKNVDVFYFGSVSEFNKLCYNIVSDLKLKYTNIKRVYIRAEYQYINDFYYKYLLESYEDSFFPDKVSKAGRCSYVKRNEIMIEKSEYCIFYYNENYLPEQKRYSKKNRFLYQPNSGTKLAYDYALRKKKNCYNFFCID